MPLLDCLMVIPRATNMLSFLRRVCFLAVYCFCPLECIATPETGSVVRVGILVPLSGPVAEYGNLSVTGARLALAELQPQLNKAGVAVELFPEDDQCRGRIGVSAYHSLIRVKKVDIILGPICNARTGF